MLQLPKTPEATQGFGVPHSEVSSLTAMSLGFQHAHRSVGKGLWAACNTHTSLLWQPEQHWKLLQINGVEPGLQLYLIHGHFSISSLSGPWFKGSSALSLSGHQALQHWHDGAAGAFCHRSTSSTFYLLPCSSLGFCCKNKFSFSTGGSHALHDTRAFTCLFLDSAGEKGCISYTREQGIKMHFSALPNTGVRFILCALLMPFSSVFI